MRKTFVLVAASIALILAVFGFVLTAGSRASSAKMGSPHFACVAAWNLGLCVGPPTTQG